MLLESRAAADAETAALAALFCLDAARLPGRLDDDGVFVPLAEQDRSRWDEELIERGLAHLAVAAGGDAMSRWHLEAGIACEHAVAPSIEATDWARIVDFYDLLAARSPGPVVALNRALAVAERDGVESGRRELLAVASEKRLADYPFYWAALADLERRGGRDAEARDGYQRAIELSRGRAERESYARRIALLEIS
jgi:predicted RNA polymerase sigma factor